MEYIPAKNIVTRTKSSGWFGCDYNMNIYRGCCHGCIYCDSRSDCYGIKSFDTVKAKKDALAIIRNDLKRKVKKGVICTGAMSDPYNPFEKELSLTREALKLIDYYGFGVAVATKSPLITRDIDILNDISCHSHVIAKITITALDETAAVTEPGAAPPSDRFKAVKMLSSGGIFAGVLLMPVLPFITDTDENIKSIVRLTRENGGKFVYAALGVTLRDGQREYFYDNLDKSYPGLKEKYISAYKNSYSCPSAKAKELWDIFTKECKRYEILYNMKDIINAFKNTHRGKQLTFFD